MAYQVFISHSSQNKNVADAITTFLEKWGLNCWIAPRDIQPGESYGEAILRAIYQCSVVVLVFSEYANQSKHVLKEIERAINADCVIIPFRIEAVMPTGAMEYFLSSDHWLDAMSGPMERHMKQLESAIQGVLGDGVGHVKIMPTNMEMRQAAEELEELAPDEWGKSKSGFFSKMYKMLFADNE